MWDTLSQASFQIIANNGGGGGVAADPTNIPVGGPMTLLSIIMLLMLGSFMHDRYKNQIKNFNQNR